MQPQSKPLKTEKEEIKEEIKEENNSVWIKLPKETRTSLLAVLNQMLAKEIQRERQSNYESEKSQ